MLVIDGTAAATRLDEARRMVTPASCAVLLALVLTPFGWVGLVQVVVLNGRGVPSWWVPAALLVLAAALHLATRRRTPRPQPRPGRAARIGLTLVASGAVLITAGVEVLLGSASYTTLTPTGPDGCRVVVRQTSFLFISNRTLLAADGAWTVAHAVGAYSDDDGSHDPFAAGDYILTWAADGTGLVARGDSAAPDVPPVRCR